MNVKEVRLDIHAYVDVAEHYIDTEAIGKKILENIIICIKSPNEDDFRVLNVDSQSRVVFTNEEP